ncbi:MAG: glutamate racemase [Chloroflexota bacterium]
MAVRKASGPIGVFDSGVGGLAVLFELERLLPREAFVYFADTLNCPWGSRPDQEIVDLAFRATDALLEQGVKLIVVACNSATTVALPALRARYPIPFVGTEPAVKPAAIQTQTGRIGVLATRATIRSGALRRLADQHAEHVDVKLFACPDRLVELVERAEIDGPEVLQVLSPIIDAALKCSVDVLVLGCTHYAFLRGAIQKLAGPDVLVLDTGAPVARQAQRVLDIHGIAATMDGIQGVHFLASSNQAGLCRVAQSLRRSVSNGEPDAEPFGESARERAVLIGEQETTERYQK